MENQAGIQFVGILIQVIDPGRVEAAGPPLNAMHRIALLQQQLSQVTAVLARDAGDQGCFEGRHGQGNAMNKGINRAGPGSAVGSAIQPMQPWIHAD